MLASPAVPRVLLLTSCLAALLASLVLGSGKAAAAEPACPAIVPDGTVNAPDGVRAGPAQPLPSLWANGPAGLPGHVYLRGSTATFNRLYEFVTAGGDIYARRRDTDEAWRSVPLPACLDGKVSEIAADDDEMIVLDGGRHIYTMDNALKDPLLWNFSARWGAPVWTGPGFAIPTGTSAWTWSVISPAEDEHWTDPAGNRTDVGTFKVSHIWGLRAGGRRMTFWDPWLPRDQSYEMCGPKRGRFRAVNISGSGSHLFVIGRHGDMFTRLYDFDVSGLDPIFFDYTYEDQRGKGDGSPIQLPAEPWKRQPKIPGQITSAISISKLGIDAIHGTLRVEGVRRGKTGYWQRDLAAPFKRPWSFRPTGEPLSAKRLDNPRRDTSGVGLAPSEDRRYVMRSGGMRAEIDDFNTYCSPGHIRITQGGKTQTVLFHHVDGLRQTERARGLDAEPRQQYGALRWPSGRIEEVPVEATLDKLVVGAWTFAAGG